MSLLNEILKDLAQKNPLKQVPTLVFGTLSYSYRKAKKTIVLSSAALVLLLCTGLFLNAHLLLKKTTAFKTDEHRDAKTDERFTSVIAPIPVYEKENDEAMEAEVDAVADEDPVVEDNHEVDSEREPALAQESDEWDQTNGELDFGARTNDEKIGYEALLDGENKDSKSAVGHVKKVYVPLTQKEWHAQKMNEAIKAIDEGHDQLAMALLKTLLVKIPEAIDARQNLATLYLSYRKYALASQVIREGLVYDPDSPALLTIKARLFLEKGKAPDAIKLLSSYRPLMSKYPDFYSTLAAALQSEGKIKEAGNLYRALIQVDPDNGQYWLGYGIYLEHNHKTNEAQSLYTRVIQNHDVNPEVRAYAENRLKVLQG